MRLLVNVDHIATLRNARGEGYPDPVEAADICERSGAAGIVFHLRKDRRHIRDQDVYRLNQTVRGVLDFEMAPTDEMISISRDVNPDLVTLVPEGREELTTEGGLEMEEVYEDFKERVIPPLKEASIAISLFLDPVNRDIELASELGVEAIELHTGPFANCSDVAETNDKIKRLRDSAEYAHRLGMEVNAGHGLNLKNLPQLVEEVPHLHDISIGHALVSKSIFNGLPDVIESYLGIINKASKS